MRPRPTDPRRDPRSDRTRLRGDPPAGSFPPSPCPPFRRRSPAAPGSRPPPSCGALRPLAPPGTSPEPAASACLARPACLAPRQRLAVLGVLRHLYGMHRDAALALALPAAHHCQTAATRIALRSARRSPPRRRCHRRRPAPAPRTPRNGAVAARHNRSPPDRRSRASSLGEAMAITRSPSAHAHFDRVATDRPGRAGHRQRVARLERQHVQRQAHRQAVHRRPVGSLQRGARLRLARQPTPARHNHRSRHTPRRLGPARGTTIAITRLPGFHSLPSPALSTVPANSMPGSYGGLRSPNASLGLASSPGSRCRWGSPSPPPLGSAPGPAPARARAGPTLPAPRVHRIGKRSPLACSSLHGNRRGAALCARKPVRSSVKQLRTSARPG